MSCPFSLCVWIQNFAPFGIEPMEFRGTAFCPAFIGFYFKHKKRTPAQEEKNEWFLQKMDAHIFLPPFGIEVCQSGFLGANMASV